MFDFKVLSKNSTKTEEKEKDQQVGRNVYQHTKPGSFVYQSETLRSWFCHQIHPPHVSR